MRRILKASCWLSALHACRGAPQPDRLGQWRSLVAVFEGPSGYTTMAELEPGKHSAHPPL